MKNLRGIGILALGLMPGCVQPHLGVILVAGLGALAPVTAHAQYVNPYGSYGRTYAPPPAVMNTSPFANGSNSYQIYNSQGQYRGNLNTNQFDPNSVANPFGPYGSPFSPTSPNTRPADTREPRYEAGLFSFGAIRAPLRSPLFSPRVRDRLGTNLPTACHAIVELDGSGI